MTHNRAAIFAAAWAETRDMMVRFSYAAEQLREVFANCLSRAWGDAKAAAALLARSAASLASEIEAMENTDRLGWEGIQRLRKLRDAYHAAEAREELEARRELIRAAHGRFVGVTFTKKDGRTRHMTVQPAALRHHVKGPEAAPAARRAAETRAQRHPHLLPVWDTEAQAIRSVNLATVSRIAVDGTVHHFTAGH